MFRTVFIDGRGPWARSVAGALGGTRLGLVGVVPGGGCDPFGDLVGDRLAVSDGTLSDPAALASALRAHGAGGAADRHDGPATVAWHPAGDASADEPKLAAELSVAGIGIIAPAVSARQRARAALVAPPTAEERAAAEALAAIDAGVTVLRDERGEAAHLHERRVVRRAAGRPRLCETPGQAGAGAACDAAVSLVRQLDLGGLWTVTETGGRVSLRSGLVAGRGVTELHAGANLALWEVALAAGEPLWFDQAAVRRIGHVVSASLFAEDPDDDFSATSGRVTALRWPSGLGLRTYSELFDGAAVDGRGGHPVAEIVAAGPNECEAWSKLEIALGQVRIDGVTTDLAWHREAVASVAAAAAGW